MLDLQLLELECLHFDFSQKMDFLRFYFSRVGIALPDLVLELFPRKKYFHPHEKCAGAG